MTKEEQQEYAEKGGWMFDSIRNIRQADTYFEISTPDFSIYMHKGVFYKDFPVAGARIIAGNLTNKYLRMKVEQYADRLEEQAKRIKRELNT